MWLTIGWISLERKAFFSRRCRRDVSQIDRWNGCNGPSRAHGTARQNPNRGIPGRSTPDVLERVPGWILMRRTSLACPSRKHPAPKRSLSYAPASNARKKKSKSNLGRWCFHLFVPPLARTSKCLVLSEGEPREVNIRKYSAVLYTAR
jgi:hypothetical protein